MKTKTIQSKRNLYLITGVLAMLFSGVLYAWSILKAPFKEVFAWSDSSLALNFTLTMCFFCLGAFAGSLICKKIGPKITLVISGLLVGVGFGLTGLLTAEKLWLLYVAYAFLAGSGIGISYNVVVSTVSAWFPDRKGFCSGCLMMGFGLSTLILGSTIEKLYAMPDFGWSKTLMLIGVIIAAVLIVSGLILKRPDAGAVLPEAKVKGTAKKDTAMTKDYTTKEMLKSMTFWRAFVCLAFITAVGNSVISFAKDLALSVDATPALATTLVGVLAVCNGFGRILTGAVYDALGRRATMIAANILTISAAGITLVAVMNNSLILCVVGLCLTGITYGSCPTISSAFSSSFFGLKYFPVNYSITNFNLIVAAFIAAGSNSLFISTGSYTAPFIMLLALAVVALGLNFTIKNPEA